MGAKSLLFCPITQQFQSTNSLNARPFFLEVLTVYGYELHLFWAKAFPLICLLMLRISHSSSRTIFNIFSYDAVLKPATVAQHVAHSLVVGKVMGLNLGTTPRHN